MVHEEMVCEEPAMSESRVCSRVAGENADIYFFFLFYRVVRNASNKY